MTKYSVIYKCSMCGEIIKTKSVELHKNHLVQWFKSTLNKISCSTEFTMLSAEHSHDISISNKLHYCQTGDVGYLQFNGISPEEKRNGIDGYTFTHIH